MNRISQHDQKRAVNTADIPTNWEACTKPQIEWLAENGSYMQRIIAGRYLRDWVKDHQS